MIAFFIIARLLFFFTFDVGMCFGFESSEIELLSLFAKVVLKWYKNMISQNKMEKPSPPPTLSHQSPI